jgi:nucleotide-binding universal stress UspA family protein
MFQRILAPLDGSELAEKSLPYVKSLAQKYDAEVILGWVVPLRTYAMSDFQPIDYGLAALLDTSAEKDRAADYLQRLRAQLHKRQIRCSYQIAEGYSIADAIVAMAKAVNADLIVKTTYARLGPSRWLQGNIAALVLQRAPCPVFLVRVSGDEKYDELLDATPDATTSAATTSMTEA